MNIIKSIGRKAAIASTASVMALASSNALAFGFEWGDIEGSVNVLMSAGATFRAQEIDYDIVSKRSNPGQAGLGAGDDVLCADSSTGGDPTTAGGPTEDQLGGCVLNAVEHLEFVQAPGSYTQNSDQGNLNYEKGDVVHAAFKTTLDLDMTWEDYGLFARVITFYDPTAVDFEETHVDVIHQNAVSQRPKSVEDDIAFSSRLEDFYAYGSWDVFDRTLSVNVGKQVVSWGESLTFVVNSINSANAPNVIRLNTPGLDLKELFTPTEMVKAGIDITDNVSMEAFYQLKWKPIIIPPIGDFFSTSDVAGTGQGYAMLAFGKEPEDPGNIQDQFESGSADTLTDAGGTTGTHADAIGRGCINDGTNFGDDTSIYTAQDRDAFGEATNPASQVPDRVNEFGFYQAEREGDTTYGRTICRAADQTPDDKGQWGVKFNYYAEWLNDTEFGFYYMNYHSRLPYASFIAADINDDAADHPLHGTISTLFTAGQTDADGDGALDNSPEDIAAVDEDDADVLGALTRVDSAAVFLEYPEDIEMYGISFNTTIGDLSLSGEVAYRPDLPLQLSGVDATLFALSPAFGQSRDAAAPSYLEAYRFGNGLSYEEYWNGEGAGANTERGRGPRGIYCSTRSNSDSDIGNADNTCANGTNLGTSVIPAGAIIRGYERLPVAHYSSTMLYATSANPFGADQWILIGDLGATQVFDMPSLDQVQFSAPGDDNWYGEGRHEIDLRTRTPSGDLCNTDTNVLTTALAGLAGIPPQVNATCAIGLLRQTPVTEDPGTFATSFSWGFRVLSFLKYNNLIFGANLNQLFGVFVDVNGNSPGPGGNFVEGRKRFLWGSEFTRGDWTLNLKYNWFTGAGDRNLENDRDNYSIDIKYSF